MENLPILQDFVPYRGRCPATAQLQPKNCIKRGKGTADHMMPLGDWFLTDIGIEFLEKSSEATSSPRHVDTGFRPGGTIEERN